MFKSILCILLILIFTGCAMFKSNICQNIPEGQTSVICQLALATKVSPENMSITLQIANMAALEKNLYTAKEAGKFIDSIIIDLKNYKTSEITISYYQAIDYLNKKFKLLSPQAQVAFIIINPGALSEYKIDSPLSSYDIDLIINHLVKERAIVSAYGG